MCFRLFAVKIPPTSFTSSIQSSTSQNSRSRFMALTTHTALNLAMKLGADFMWFSWAPEAHNTLQIQRQKWSLIEENLAGCKDLGLTNYSCASPSTRSIRKQKKKKKKNLTNWKSRAVNSSTRTKALRKKWKLQKYQDHFSL